MLFPHVGHWHIHNRTAGSYVQRTGGDINVCQYECKYKSSGWIHKLYNLLGKIRF